MGIKAWVREKWYGTISEYKEQAALKKFKRTHTYNPDKEYVAFYFPGRIRAIMRIGAADHAALNNLRLQLTSTLPVVSDPNMLDDTIRYIDLDHKKTMGRLSRVTTMSNGATIYRLVRHHAYEWPASCWLGIVIAVYREYINAVDKFTVLGIHLEEKV